MDANANANTNTNTNNGMGRFETIMRLSVAGIGASLIFGALFFIVVRVAVGAIVSDPTEATAATSVLCIGGLATIGLTLILLAATYLMTSRQLTAALATNDGTRALLMSSANRQDADADIRRAIAAVLQNPTASRDAESRDAESPMSNGVSYPLLPARRTINVPIITNRGKPITLLHTVTRDEDGKPDELNVDIALIKSVMSVHPDAPTRARLQVAGIASNMEQADVLKFLRAHGWVKAGEKGRAAEWADGISRDDMLTWLSQFDAGAHVRAQGGVPSPIPASVGVGIEE
jgi:hypothetical protein